MDNKEEKAKEYVQQFRVENAPVGSAIEMGKAAKHFKAGFEAGKQEREIEIIEKLKYLHEEESPLTLHVELGKLIEAYERERNKRN